MSTNQLSNEDVVKELYTALNLGDIPAVIELFDPQIERVEPKGFPTSGTYRGHSELLKHFSQARETWAEGGCYPEQFINLGNKVVVFVHVHVRLKDKIEWIDAHIADGYVLKNSKLLEMHTFFKQEEALEWIGIS